MHQRSSYINKKIISLSWKRYFYFLRYSFCNQLWHFLNSKNPWNSVFPAPVVQHWRLYSHLFPLLSPFFVSQMHHLFVFPGIKASGVFLLSGFLCTSPSFLLIWLSQLCGSGRTNSGSTENKALLEHVGFTNNIFVLWCKCCRIFLSQCYLFVG